jgi:hypothetical protein
MNTVERNPQQRTLEPFATLGGGDEGGDPLAEQARDFLRAAEGAVDDALSIDSTQFLNATRQSTGGQ